MKVCASSICWVHDDRMTLLKKAADAGFDAVEMLIMAPETAPFHNHSLRTTTVATLIQEYKQFNLKCAGLHIGGVSTDGRLAGQLEYAHMAVDAASEIGANLLVMGGPDRASEPFKPYIQAVESLVPHLEQKGVRLALENHHMNWLQFIQDYDFVFDFIKSPMVGMTLDTGHFTAANVDPEEVARKFAPRIFHVHVKDHIGARSVEMGLGVTNNRGCVIALREAGYTGFFSQELELFNHEDTDRAAAEGFRYMKTLVAQHD